MLPREVQPANAEPVVDFDQNDLTGLFMGDERIEDYADSLDELRVIVIGGEE